MSAPVFILWFFFLPETLGDTILLQRARRLRKRYPHLRIQSSSEMKRRGLKPRTIVIDAIIKPFEIMILDPAVLFTNIYTALIYGTYYSFFESFPLVYGPLYGFNMGVEGVAFLVIVVGVAITMPMYFALMHFIVIPDIKKNGMKSQEEVLKPALIATFGPPIALFMFGSFLAQLFYICKGHAADVTIGWTANVHVNYIASIIAIGIYAGTVSGLSLHSLRSGSNETHETVLRGSPRHLHLPPDVVPSVRSISVRWERLLALRTCIRGDSL